MHQVLPATSRDKTANPMSFFIFFEPGTSYAYLIAKKTRFVSLAHLEQSKIRKEHNMRFPQMVELVLSGSFTPACDLERLVNAGSLSYETANAALQSMIPYLVISVADEAQRERRCHFFHNA